MKFTRRKSLWKCCMMPKNYHLAILTANEDEAGTTAEVWIRFNGSLGSTDWFALNGPNVPPGRRQFVRGRIDYATFDSTDIGNPQVCAIALRGDAGGSWIPQSVELIDGTASYTWQFGMRLRAGDEVACDAPLRDDTLTLETSRPSVYDHSLAEARRVLTNAIGEWKSNNPAAPAADDVLNAILTIFEDARLIHRPSASK
jgi:hypothetical protein